MPLSEFHWAATKAKPESTQSKMASCTSDVSSSMPDHDFVELLWENGQIVMQGQSNRPKKSSYPTFFPSDSLRVQEKDGRDHSFQKFSHFEPMDSTVSELSPAVPCANIGLNAQDDNMAPWIDYPMEDPLCSEFFSELAGINPNQPSTTERSNGFAVRDFHNVENGHSSKALREGSEPSKFRINQLLPSSQQCQSSTANTKSGLIGFSVGGRGTTSTHQGSQFQKQNTMPSSKPLAGSSGIGLLNFSHFSRPASVARANNESLERLKANEKVSLATAIAAPMESTLIEPSGTRGNSALDLRKVEMRSAAKAKGDVICVEQSEAVCRVDASRKNHQNNSVVANNNGTSPDHHINCQSSSFATRVAVGRHEAEKGTDPIVASSSVCSGSSAGAAANDPKHRVKRKNREGEDSGYHSEDLDDGSAGLKKPTAGEGGTSTKRSRAAEVHNLSERRRRDRINEKMRALQELIPNCNKVDKASMLDEAIDYLKTLQLQVQMMSMGSGLCMPPMMLPPGMQHIHAAQMAHFSPMGVGMGMGMGLGYGMGMLDMNGSPSCPPIPVPSMHTTQFPCSPIPGNAGSHGIPGSTGLQLFGIPGHGQGLPMSMPRAPLFSPLSGLAAKGSSTNEVSGSMVNPLPVSDVGHSSRSKDRLQQQQSINLEATQKTSNSQPQVAKQSFDQSHLVKMSNQALHANGNAAANSVKDTGNASSR